MRKVLLLLAPLALAAPFAATAATESADATRTICHRTSSAKKPYAKLRISDRQLRAHQRHAADIIPAPAGACPRTVMTATRGGTALTTNLVGELETPTGDPVGIGTATIRVRRGEGRLCFSIRAENITLPAAGAHIHSGGLGEAGPISITLRAPGENGSSSGCVNVSRARVAQILANRALYYVNVHTTDFPAGAIRGQLGGALAPLGRTIVTQMNGAQECNAAGVCNLGDPDGAGTWITRFRADAEQVCFRITVSNITLPAVGAHIHRAPRGVAGPIVVPVTSPNASGTTSGCVASTRALMDEIQANPAGFYANVHTTDYPPGAVRGQLG